MDIAQIRAKYPQYSDLSDKQLADALHGKFYSDIPIGDYYKRIGFAPEPAAVSKIKGLFPTPVADVLHQVADVPIGLQKGVMQGIRMVSDMFGANNAFSKSVKQNEEALANLMSAQSKNDQQEIARILKEAEDKGVLDQIKAGVKAFTVAPVDTLTSALGTAAPAIVAALGAKVLGAGALLTTGISMATGAGMGAGTIKGTIYEETKKALEEAGVPEPVAEERAMKAQEYGGQNLDQILAGVVIGGVAAKGPLEKGAVRAIASRISKNVAAREAAESVSEKVAKGAATGRIRAGVAEALPEAGQAAQEQIAANIAQQREGLDVPTFRGAVAAGTMEGLGGGVLGATFGGKRAPMAPTPGAQPGETPIERAAREAAEKAAAKAAQQPATPPEVPVGKTTASEVTKEDLLDLGQKTGLISEKAPAPPVAETPAPPPIEEPKVRKPGEPPAGGMQSADIEALGISKKQPIYRRMLGKDLENPEQRAAVLEDIENYLTRGNGSEESRTKLAEFKAKFAPPPVVETPAVPPAEAPVGGAPTPPAATPTVQTVPVTAIYNKHTDNKGITNAGAVADEIVAVAEDALNKGQTVNYVVEGKSHQIVAIKNGMMQDNKGQRWGTLLLTRDRNIPDGARLQIGTPAVELTPVSEAPSVPSVPTKPEAGGAGAPVAGKPAAVAAPEGAGAPVTTGVVPPVADVGQPAGRERATPAPVAAPTKPTPAEITRGEYEPPVKAGLKPERERQLREKLAQQRKELAVLEAARDKAEGNIYLAEITGNEEAKARAIDAHEAARLVLKKATAAADRTYAQIFDMEKADFEGSVGEAYVAELRAEQTRKAEAARAPELTGSYPYNLKTAEAVQEELRDQASHLPGYKELIEKYFTPSRQLRKGKTEEEFVKEGQKFLSSNTLYQLRQKPAAGMRKEQVENVVAKVTKGWTNLPPIEVVQSETDLPVNIQRQLERDKVSGQVPGLFNDGKVWLIADNNAAPAEIFDTIAHEVTGHYGLQGVLGDKYSDVMGRIYNSNSDIRMKAVDKMQKLPKLTRDVAVEEVLADMQEKDRSRPFYKRVVGIIRTALQKLFKGKHYFSPDQIEDLLRQSRVWVKRGKKSEGTTTKPTDGAQFRLSAEATAAAAEADAIGERKQTTLTEKVGRELQGNTALRLREKFTDSMAPLEDFFVNAYGGQIRTAGGRLNPMVLLSRALDALRVSKAVQEQGGLGREDGLIVATELKNAAGENISYQGVLKRIADAAKKAGKTYEEYQKTIDNVLYGHREFNLRERNKTLDADEQVDLLLDDKQIDALEAAFQKDAFIKGISADLDAIRFNLLDTLVETGRISKEQAQDYKDAIGYIPFERIGDYENAWTGATRGANRGAAALKKMRKLEGSNRKSTSVVENFSGLVDWATKEAMKNEAASRALDDMVLLGAAKRGPKPATDSPGGEVQVFKDGKLATFYVPDPAHLVTFSIADPQLSKILKAMQRGSQVLRAGVTSMPPFAIKQVFDDVVRAYTYAGVKNNTALVKEVLFNFPKNWMNEILKRKPKGIRELEALGIVGTFDFTQQGGNLQNILEGAGAKKEGLGHTILRVMEAGAKASDIAVREAIYKQVLKETGDKAQAESAAREIINFSRRGSSKMMSQMISIIPFFNAYARGMDKLATAAAGKVVGQTTGTARSMFYSRMAVLTAMGLAYALMMQDDEEYNKLPDHVRDTNWILPYGKELGFTPAIPIPADLAFFFKAIPERLVRYYKYQGTDEERTAMEVLGELTKRGIDVFSSPNITPQILRPFVENAVNYSFFLGRPLESQAQLKLRPFERYGTGTSDAMKATAKLLEDAANATGIEAFAISPIKLENAVRGLLGTAAGLSLSMADMMVNPDRTDRPLHQQLIPQLTGAAAVMKNPVGTRYMDEIYSLENRVEQVYTTYNRLKKDDPDKADKFLDDNIGMYEIRPAVRAVMEEIRKLNKMAMDIDKDTTLSPEQRRKEIDELRVEQNDIARVVFSLRKEARDIQMGL